MESPKTTKASASSSPTLRLRVTAAAERHIRSGHPWLFADSVRDQNRPGVAGELAILYDRANRFLAAGLYDPSSAIRVRILHRGTPRTIDTQWFQNHLREAFSRRRGLFDDETMTGYRCIHGESDGWPGLVLDRYAATYVLKLYSTVWLPRLDELLPLLEAVCQPSRLVLRLSRNIQETARAQFGRTDGECLRGSPPAEAVTFLESGLEFEAEVLKGQKTGFFLDQRENRQRVEKLANGRDVLNAFSFSGGFAVYAARGGARSVTNLDISSHALASAGRNWRLNSNRGLWTSCRYETVQSDAFAWLESNAAAEFDLVILDPPSLARRETERAGAIQAYGRLVAAGIRRLRPRGILVAASCSAHVSADEFFGAVRQAAHRSGRAFTELATTAHPPDHPAGFAEAVYLKCVYLRF